MDRQKWAAENPCQQLPHHFPHTWISQLLYFDAVPEHRCRIRLCRGKHNTRGIEQLDVLIQVNLLNALGDARGVANLEAAVRRQSGRHLSV